MFAPLAVSLTLQHWGFYPSPHESDINEFIGQMRKTDKISYPLFLHVIKSRKRHVLVRGLIGFAPALQCLLCFIKTFKKHHTHSIRLWGQMASTECKLQITRERKKIPPFVGSRHLSLALVPSRFFFFYHTAESYDAICVFVVCTLFLDHADI